MEAKKCHVEEKELKKLKRQATSSEYVRSVISAFLKMNGRCGKNVDNVEAKDMNGFIIEKE